jgi:phosphate transport system substrate-binding protein
MKMQNRDGRYVDPDDITFAAAARDADWFKTPGMGISLGESKEVRPHGPSQVLLLCWCIVNPRDPQASTRSA